MLDSWIAESTECEYKEAVETQKPKSWLKSVCAFANGAGGTLFFGVDDQHNIIGLAHPQTDAESISRLIKDRVSPYPNFLLSPVKEQGKALLILSVFAGSATPYYYKADGKMETFIRIGNESISAPNYILNQLVLKGMNRTYDALSTEYKFTDFSFSKLRERFKAWTGRSLEPKMFDSFGIKDSQGKLTHAGALIADDSPIRHSRLFCTRWTGLDKSGGLIDAFDTAEYSGSLILMLDDGLRFVRHNMSTRWKKTATSRIEMPDYCERSIQEALVNALIHRDYLVIGSEVHIDIYDDRLTIYSPGGMADGTKIQERDIADIASVRRNPVLADLFSRLGYMERQGSGFHKITEAYHLAHNYRPALEPRFFSDQASFQITLFNLNYGQESCLTMRVNETRTDISVQPPVAVQKQVVTTQKQAATSQKQVAIAQKQVATAKKQVATTKKQVAIAQKQVAITQKQAVADYIATLGFGAPTTANILLLCDHLSPGTAFARADVMRVTGLTASPATELLRKLKDAHLITSTASRGKYMFINLQQTEV